MIKGVTCGLCVAAGMLMAQAPQPAPRKMAAFTTSAPAFALPAVTGSPYSAEQITEHNQTLADGTHIVQPPNKTLLFRDSQGRTRTERPMMFGFGKPGPTMVTIEDPVAGCRYTLDTQNDIAHRQETQPLGSRPGMARVGGSFSAFLAAAPPPLPPPPPPSGTGQGVASPGIIFTAPATGTVQAQLPKPVTESLGTQILEGVEVEGRRTTFTIPEGAQGNDRPITSTHETWMSPKLKTAVLTKSVDPRSGENTTKLTNIVLGEPDPALFQPPADFEVVDDKGPVTVTYQSPQ
jgi:hypothetical protein